MLFRSYPAGGNPWLPGLLTRAAIYNTILSPARIAAHALRDIGVKKVVTARSGAEALDIFFSEPSQDFDLIISDWSMPGISGLELLRKVRAVSPLTPFVMLTSNSGGEFVLAARDNGVNGYIVKPFAPAQLEAKLGIQVESIQPALTLAQQAAAHGPELWKRDPEKCCELRKVDSLGQKLFELDLWIAGMRRDQSTERSSTPLLSLAARPDNSDVWKLNPLVDWSRDQVWAYLKQHDLPHNVLHDRGYRSIGCWPCTDRKSTRLNSSHTDISRMPSSA